MDYTVHGILQARILEWIVYPFSRGYIPNPGIEPGLLHCRWILYQLSYQVVHIAPPSWDASSRTCPSSRTQFSSGSLLVIWKVEAFIKGFPNEYIGISRWFRGKESACQCRRCRKHGYDPGVGKIPSRRKWQSTPVFLPRKFHGQNSLAGYSPWGCKEVNMSEWLNTHTLSVFPSLALRTPQQLLSHQYLQPGVHEGRSLRWSLPEPESPSVFSLWHHLSQTPLYLGPQPQRNLHHLEDRHLRG